MAMKPNKQPLFVSSNLLRRELLCYVCDSIKSAVDNLKERKYNKGYKWRCYLRYRSKEVNVLRKNFAQILKSANIDLKAEYQKLYSMLFDRSIQVSASKAISAFDEMSDCFAGFYFRGTCLSIEEFNDLHGFHFDRDPEDFSIDNLVTLCEYIYNMLMGYQSATHNNIGFNYMPLQSQGINIQFYFMQIATVIEKIGFMPATQDGFTIFVEKSPAAVAVAESEMIPEELSYKIISYNHHSMHGNIIEKKNVILQLADLLEAKREKLTKIDRDYSSDLFYAFNKFNLRHNNIDPDLSSKYVPAIAEMKSDELELWYDEVYQMCLLAFLRLEQDERKIEFDELKKRIEQK